MEIRKSDINYLYSGRCTKKIRQKTICQLADEKYEEKFERPIKSCEVFILTS